MRRMLHVPLLSALALVLMTQRADATFHLNLIAELYPGSYAKPDAQYVMLRSQSPLQNRIAGKAIITFNPDGTRGPDFGTFTTDSANTASGARYLMTTSSAQTLFGFTRTDGTASGRLPSPSGRICFVDPASGLVVDCVAYGAYTGSNTGFGAPAVGLVSQKALVRVVFSTVSKNNATDFGLGPPNPLNSFGDTSPDGDGDGVPNVSDCAPGDSSVYLVPFESKNLVVSRATGPTGLVTRVAWDDQSLLVGPQTVYDLVSGDLASLHTPEPFGGATCLGSRLPAPSFDDARSDPGAGLGVYYLSRARNGCGDGTYGDSSLSPDPRDFLDSPSTTPCP
jgi:hypothetical protein